MVHEIIPSTNIKLEDIRDTLNANGGNVTNVLGTFFKDAAKINKWAKFKPVSYKGDFPTGGKQWEGDANSSIWGMIVSILNNAESQGGGKSVYDRPLNSDYNYKYNIPVGGVNSPYRLQDFCGYYPKAKPIFIQEMDRNKEIFVSSTLTETDSIYYSVFCGVNKEEVKFSDIEEVTRYDSSYGLHLVLSIYRKGTDTLIGEYFNNGIPLYKYVSKDIDTSYDIAGCKMASISFAKTAFWGNGISEVDVYLSLQTIRKDATPSGKYYHADKIIALPFDHSYDFVQSIKFRTYNRYIRATKIHLGSIGSTRNWVTLSSSNPFDYPRLGTPDIMFEVNKIYNETLTFQNGVCFLRTKHVRRDGGMTVVSGTLTSESGSNVPPTVTVPTGTSGVVNVYFHFGDILQEPEYYNGQKLTSGQYMCELFLVKVADDVETETCLESFPLFINVPS